MLTILGSNPPRKPANQKPPRSYMYIWRNQIIPSPAIGRIRKTEVRVLCKVLRNRYSDLDVLFSMIFYPRIQFLPTYMPIS